MRPKITVWTQSGCPRCVRVIRWFRDNGYEVEVKSGELADLIQESPAVRNEMRADLAKQNDTFPLVYAEGKAFEPAQVETIIKLAWKAYPGGAEADGHA